MPFKNGPHDRVGEQAFLQHGGHDGDAPPLHVVGRAHDPFAPVVAQAADVEFRVQGMHEDFRALPQHVAGRGHVVGNGQKVVGHPQQRFRIALHGRDGGEQVHEAAPAFERHSPHFGLVAGIKGPFHGGHEGQDGRAHFGRGVLEKTRKLGADVFGRVLRHNRLHCRRPTGSRRNAAQGRSHCGAAHATGAFRRSSALETGTRPSCGCRRAASGERRCRARGSIGRKGYWVNGVHYFDRQVVIFCASIYNNV